MKHLMTRVIDSLFDRLADRIAKRLVNHYYFVEFHPETTLARQASREAAEYVLQHMPMALHFPERDNLMRFSVDKMTIPGQVLEFGVSYGKSIRQLAACTDRVVWGFDSFQGLPEDWSGNRDPKGRYSTGGTLPSVPANVKLVAGWYEDTLGRFFSEHDEPCAFAHIDCDIYSSTRTVFKHLAPRLRVGTILVFDEYFNFHGWKDHEYKAFQELVSETGIEYEYLAYARHQVTVRITSSPFGK
jgi:predicted O-methyltransferase YrrM